MSDPVPIETASLFFVADAPLPALVKLLRALKDADLLADLDVDADVDALATEANALSGLFTTGRARLDDFLTALATVTSSGAPRTRFFYLRLAAPEALPASWRAELVERLGELPAAPGELFHTHPYEFFVALDLGDVEGRATAGRLAAQRKRPHPHLPAALQMVDATGSPVDARAGFELRCAPETLGPLAFVLGKQGLLEQSDVLVRVLD